MKLPPERDGHERSTRGKTRAQARRNQWPPPLAWENIDDPAERPHGMRDETDGDHIDPIVVDRILAGDFTLTATRAERHEVIRRWAGSQNELARRTGWNVSRDLREMRDLRAAS